MNRRPATTRQPTTRRLGRVVGRERGMLLGLLVFGLLNVALTAAGPWLLGRATDLVLGGALGRRFEAGTTADGAIERLRAEGHGTLADVLGTVPFTPGEGVDFGAVGRMLLAATLVYLAAGLCGVLQAWLANVVSQRVLERLRDEVESKIHRVPLEYFDRQRRGDVLSRVTNDLDNLGQAVALVLGQFVVPALSIVGMLAVMFWVSWVLALIALVTAPLSVLVVALVVRRAQPAYARQWRHTGELNGHIEEMFDGHGLLRVFGQEQAASDTFAEGNERLTRATVRAQSLSGATQPAMMFIGNLNYVLIAVVGGMQVAAGALTVGGVQAFVQYSRQYSQPFSYLAGMSGMAQSGLASAERVFELLDAPEQHPDPVGPVGPVGAAVSDGERGTPGLGRVTFEHVSFRYRPDRPLIEDLQLVAEPGHTVAIVGATGAGKTTLVNLLMRFYEIDAGRITVDGVDTASMTRAELRSRIGMVLQDPWLFRGTIAENIAYGRPGATRAEIVAAATAAHADRFVRTLPDGYDTLVDDAGGAGVSAGERQLLTIARALLTETPMLVLDEATSSVDTRTERLIQQASARLRQGRTAFVIAHRLSTIRDADTIVVMADGAIAEQGTHDELLGRDGAYARLYAAQFAEAPADVG